MPNKNYINGRAHEYRVRDRYTDQGYICARSAGSHSPFDVYAVQPAGPVHTEVRVIHGVEYTEYITPVTGYAIQCKRRKLAPTKPASGKRTDHRQNP
jgi:hypothetical protein